MGSLILLLLVIDRRAKVVARAKALQAQSQIVAEQTKATQAQRAEWERRRWALHEQLVQQDQDALAQVHSIQSQADTTAAKIQSAQTHDRALQERLQTERSRLTQEEEQLTARRADFAQAEKQTEASQAERVRLTAELERIERTLADLQAFRQRQQQMHSLVPYRGKHGDNRRPIYMECTADELIFHPDHFTLRGLTMTPVKLRAEIERRLAQQGSTKLVANQKPGEGAYLLLLIRPQGITTYYRATAALQGLKVDYGYEFIDQDWVLDFPEDENKASKPPWMVAEKTETGKSPTSPTKVNETPTSAAKRPGRRYQGLTAGPGNPVEERGGPPANAAGPPSFPAGGSGGTTARQGERLAAGPPGVGSSQPLPSVTQPNPSVRVATGAGLGDGQAARPVMSPSGDGPPVQANLASSEKNGNPGSSRLFPGNESSSRRGQAEGGGSSSQPPNNLNPGLPRRASGHHVEEMAALGSARPLATPRVPANGSNSELPAEVWQDLDPRARSNEQSANRGTDFQSVQEAGRIGNPSYKQEVPASGTGQVQTGAAPVAGNRQEPAVAGSPERSGGDPRPEGAGGPSSGFARDPVSGLVPRQQQKKPPRGVSPRPNVWVSNRDWIIAIECTTDALVLSPSGQRFSTTALAPGDNSLLENVRQMIARRQASVRPGEPPYRPMIRFRVHPDGLRSYYLAYPVLEALRVPMSRENLDQEETKK
jgi:hypothetical protein